ncbi:MAG: lipoate--protein ligase family protein [Paenibacillaceae bacterium]|nr:lipoate--protein ligase family protein [Paenibacillaceae bacterium]
MQWRLLRTGKQPPARNMALDEAMMHAVGAGRVPPTVRLYGWNPNTLSIGRFQRISDIDRDALAQDGYGLVRRPSGGRAVWHADEVTYAIVVPEGMDGVPTSVTASYQLWSEGICVALVRCGLPAALAPIGPRVAHGDARSAGCFDVPSAYEVVIAGRKVVGSAQWRQHGAILQHGSILLSVDAVAWDRYVGHRSAQTAMRMQERAVGINDERRARALPPLTCADVEWALIDGWGQTLGVQWRTENVTDSESEMAQKLISQTYANEAWTCKR